MSAFNPHPIHKMTAHDIARTIVNGVLDQIPQLTVEQRQALNDPLDRNISGLLVRWVDARDPNAHQRAAVEAGMTEREAETWELVRKAAGSYLRLTEDEPHHGMEREEICHAFHVIQGWLSGRPFLRALEAGGDG